MGAPVNGTVEVGGPEKFRLDELIRRGLAARKDPREVIADPHARYYGIEVSESEHSFQKITRDSERLVSKPGSPSPHTLSPKAWQGWPRRKRAIEKPADSMTAFAE